jgi:hypothetical protein
MGAIDAADAVQAGAVTTDSTSGTLCDMNCYPVDSRDLAYNAHRRRVTGG